MYSFNTTSVASSRVILSLLSHVDKIEGNMLKLKKKDISDFWATSKSSKRDINKEAVEMIDMRMQKIILTNEVDEITATVFDLNLFDHIYSTTYTIDFEFNEVLVDEFKFVAKLLLEKYKLEDFKDFSSRFTLNTLLASMDDDKVLYSVIRESNNLNEVYSENQNFYRNVIAPLKSDIHKIKTKKTKTKVLEKANPDTKRKISYALKIK